MVVVLYMRIATCSPEVAAIVAVEVLTKFLLQFSQIFLRGFNTLHISPWVILISIYLSLCFEYDLIKSPSASTLLMDDTSWESFELLGHFQ